MFLDRTAARSATAEGTRTRSAMVVVAHPAVTRLYGVDRDADAVEEVLGNGFPVWAGEPPDDDGDAARARLRASARALAYTWRIDAALRAALPEGRSVLLVGDHDLLRRLAGIVAMHRSVDGVIVSPSAGSDPLAEPPAAAMVAAARRAVSP